MGLEREDGQVATGDENSFPRKFQSVKDELRGRANAEHSREYSATETNGGSVKVERSTLKIPPTLQLFGIALCRATLASRSWRGYLSLPSRNLRVGFGVVRWLKQFWKCERKWGHERWTKRWKHRGNSSREKLKNRETLRKGESTVNENTVNGARK